MFVEGPGVPVKPGYCSFIKVKETVTYLLYIKKRLKVLKRNCIIQIEVFYSFLT